MRLPVLHRNYNLRRFSRSGAALVMAFVMIFTTALLTGCASGQTESAVSQDASRAESVKTESAQSGSDSAADAAQSESNVAADASKSESVAADASKSESVAADASKSESVAADASQAESTVAESSCPKSVVAVSKSIAELWLLSGGTLSGTTEDAMELDGITGDTAVIGTLSRPNNEAILALSPELVLMTLDIPAQKELKTELDGMGIPTKAIEIGSFEDYKTCIDELTDLTGRKDLYEQNAVQVGERIGAICNEIKETADANASAGKTFLAMRVSATKNKVFKDDYFACEIFRDFGLKNIAEGNTNLDELNLEAIVAANPDYIFVIPQGKESEAMESYKTQFEDNPVWSELDAVKEGRLFVMPKDYFQYKPNAQWDLAYEYVRDLIAEQ